MNRAGRLYASPLFFATVAFNQSGGCSRSQPNLRAVFERVPVLDRRRYHSRCDEPVELSTQSGTVRARENNPRNRPPMCGDDYTHSSLDSLNVLAEMVLQFAYACLHAAIIATTHYKKRRPTRRFSGFSAD